MDFNSEPRDSSQFAENSEILDIVFLIGTAPFVQLIDRENKKCLDKDIGMRFPNIIQRLIRLLCSDNRYTEHLEFFEKLHRELDPEFSCDNNEACFAKQMQIFEDLSNKTLVSDDRSSKHFNNRLAAISTNGHKKRVAEEHSVYRDATSLMQRGSDGHAWSADISSTRVRESIIPFNSSKSVSVRAQILQNYVDPSTATFLKDLGQFFNRHSTKFETRRIFFKLQCLLPEGLRSKFSDMHNFVGFVIGRPVAFRIDSDVFSLVGSSRDDIGSHVELRQSDQLIPGTKSEVFKITYDRLASSFRDCSHSPVDPKSLVVLKFAVDKPAGTRCGFTLQGCKCDKRWDYITEHERRISDVIHRRLSSEEKSRAISIGYDFAQDLNDFVEASFLKIYCNGRLSFRLLDADGQLVKSREDSPQFNASKFMGNFNRGPLELLHFIEMAFDFDIASGYPQFPLNEYANFFLLTLEQLTKSMAFLHQVKNVVHFDFIERNIMIIPDEISFVDGRFPSEFKVSMIDYGFSEFLGSLDSSTPTNALPTLHPRYTFGMTLGSGRPSMGLENLDPFTKMKLHDLSILSARSIELMVFGYRRKRMENWKGNSSSGSFNPTAGNSLASVLWNFPAKDSIVKDIMIRSDAAVILKNKILWGYESLYFSSDYTGEDFAAFLVQVIQECTPWLNRISSRSHPWFEEKLLENVSNGLKLLNHLIFDRGNWKFVETWLKSLYVDLGSQGKIQQMGGNVSALDLWMSLARTESTSDEPPLTSQLLHYIRSFIGNLTKEGSSLEDHLVDLNGQLMSRSYEDIQAMLDSVRYVRIGSKGIDFTVHPTFKGWDEIIFLLKTADLVPSSGANVGIEAVLATADHVKHHETLAGAVRARMESDLEFYHLGIFGTCPVAYHRSEKFFFDSKIKLEPALISRVTDLRLEYAPYLQSIVALRLQIESQIKSGNLSRLHTYQSIVVHYGPETDPELLTQVTEKLSRRYIRRADIKVVECSSPYQVEPCLFSVVVQHACNKSGIRVDAYEYLPSLYEKIDTVYPEYAVDSNGSPKFAGFFTKSSILATFPWQSLLISSADKSITQRPKRRAAKTEVSKSSSREICSHIGYSQLPGSKSALLIGDSHVEYGIDYGACGWINAISRQLGLQSALNRSASGYNSSAILTQVIPVIKEEFRRSYLLSENISFILLWAGSIDSYVEGTIKDSMRVPVDEFKENMLRIFKALRDVSDIEIPLLVVPPLSPNVHKMQEDWLRVYDCEYTDFYKFRTVEETRRYARAVKEAVDELGKALVVYVDTADFESSLGDEDYADDGLHLSAYGSSKFSEFLLQQIQQAQ